MNGPGRTRALLLACLLGAGFLYWNLHRPASTTPEWKPGPFDPPVQYAFIPEDANCPAFPPEETSTQLVPCTEWQLRVHYRLGAGRQDIDLTYGMGCDDEACNSDIGLHDAASQVTLRSSRRHSVPLRLTRDGHHVAYFSKSYLQFMGWDLPAGQRKAISPRLGAQQMEDFRSLEISPDGRFFAVSFAGAQPRLLITEFATGRTSTVPGFCAILGVSRDASRIAAQRTCHYLDESDRTTILRRDGTVISEWTAAGPAGDLSPDGRSLAHIQGDHIVTLDAMTGKLIKKIKLHLLSEPNEAIGHAWLTDREFIVQADPPEAGPGSFGYYRVDVVSGASQRIVDLGLNPGGTISLGTALIHD
ncbi:hypothetical protein GCM10022419_101830 [Nonomuraea rosea]|uniref:WD40 repeat domain-containing protein n=1 Tax=Nonomuraea rosea TaxID=638574 RepID=A0ABP6ZA81_9ACTN